MTHQQEVPSKLQYIEEWFSRRELNDKYSFDRISKERDHFWEWITGGPNVSVPGPKVLKNASKYYRGQTKSWHGFASSLYRLCKQEIGDGQVDEAHLAAAEKAVITALREEDMGRRMTDGELLMICQHHLVPTRLIDVSTKPLEALFFAVEKEDGSDGRLFVVAPHQTGNRLPQSSGRMKLSRSRSGEKADETPELPWVNSVRGTRQSKNKWSVQVRLVDGHPRAPTTVRRTRT